jgi:hypothetical protein
MTEYLKHLSSGVVEVPGRKFPGIVLMGDTLASIATDVECGLELLKSTCGSNGGAVIEIDRLEYALARLKVHLDIYEKALSEHGIRLPYETRPSRTSE